MSLKIDPVLIYYFGDGVGSFSPYYDGKIPFVDKSIVAAIFETFSVPFF
jgi:hypothetical protein